MLAMLRVATVAVAALEIFLFSDVFRLAFDTLAHPRDAQWFNVASSLGSGVIAPLLALAAAGLAAFGKRLLLAAILLGAAP